MNEHNQRTIEQSERVLDDMRAYVKTLKQEGKFEIGVIETDLLIMSGKVIKELIKAVNDQAEATKKYFELYGKEIAKEVIE